MSIQGVKDQRPPLVKNEPLPHHTSEHRAAARLAFAMLLEEQWDRKGQVSKLTLHLHLQLCLKQPYDQLWLGLLMPFGLSNGLCEGVGVRASFKLLIYKLLPQLTVSLTADQPWWEFMPGLS